MRSRNESTRLLFTALAILTALFAVFLSRTDLGNWLRKSEYAEWSTFIEQDLTAQKAQVLLVDFGTLPDEDEEFFVVVEIAEPSYEYEFERLVLDVQSVILEAYHKCEPAPEPPDSIATILHIGEGMRMGVVAPFQAAMDYARSGTGYETFADSWRYGIDFGEGYDLEE